jgi:diadenylate cyclase
MGDFAAVSKMVVEVAVFATLIYLVLSFVRRTRGTNVLRGLLYLGIGSIVTFVLLIQAMGLDRLSLLFEFVAQSVVIALIVVFHQEIRRAIVHVGESQIFAPFFRKEVKVVQRIARAAENMSKVKMGALIAIERDASLQPFADTGTPLDAELTPMLLESLFYPKSTLHDGAVIVRDNRIVAAACLLPLSQNPDVDKRLGTRHRAALGLSEETDALLVVVSEETGAMSTAAGGKLDYNLTKEQLERRVEDLLRSSKRQRRAATEKRTLGSILKSIASDPVRKLTAVALAALLWMFLDRRITSNHLATLDLDVVGIGQPLPQRSMQDTLYVNIPTDAVKVTRFVDMSTGEPAVNVKFFFTGPKTEIEQLSKEDLRLEVRLPKVEWDKVDSADFSLADVLFTHRALQDRKVQATMSPQRVRFEIVRMKTSTIQLGADQVELTFGGDERLKSRLLDESFEFTPRSVELFGPSRAFDQLAERKGERPFLAQITAASSARQASGTVQLQPQFESLGLRIRENCRVSVQLRPEMQAYTLELPVLVDDKALPEALHNRYRPDAESKTVRIKAGGALLSKLVGFEPGPRAEWARDNMRLVVWLQPREPGAAYPEKLTASARLYVGGGVLGPNATQDYELEELVTVELSQRP